MTRHPSLFFLPLLLAAGFLSFVLDKRLGPSVRPAAFQDPFYRIFGSAKEAIGDALFLKADSYFHGGVETENRSAETAEELGREGPIAEEETASPARAEDWIARVNHEVRRQEHIHLTKDKQKEMLPFFAMALELDPHNIPAILTAAFWLDKSFDRTDEAIQILRKGIANNPDAWELDAQIANLYFYRKKNYAESELHYSAAIRKAKSGGLVRFRRIDLTVHLAESYRLEGKRARALESYREASSLYDTETTTPLKEEIRERIQSLLVGE